MNQGVDTVSTEPTRYQCSLVHGRAKRKGRGGNLEEAILMALALVTLALAILMTLALRTVALGREELIKGCLLVVEFQSTSTNTTTTIIHIHVHEHACQLPRTHARTHACHSTAQYTSTRDDTHHDHGMSTSMTRARCITSMRTTMARHRHEHGH